MSGIDRFPPANSPRNAELRGVHGEAATTGLRITMYTDGRILSDEGLWTGGV